MYKGDAVCSLKGRGGDSVTAIRYPYRAQMGIRSVVTAVHARSLGRSFSTLESLPQKGDVRLIRGGSIRASFLELKQVLRRRISNENAGYRALLGVM